MEEKANRELAIKIFNSIYFRTKDLVAGQRLHEYQAETQFIMPSYRRLLPGQVNMFNATITKIITRDTLNTALTILEFQPNLKKAVEMALKKHHIDELDFNPERLYKAIQRHRAKHGGIYIYKNRKSQ